MGKRVRHPTVRELGLEPTSEGMLLGVTPIDHPKVLAVCREIRRLLGLIEAKHAEVIDGGVRGPDGIGDSERAVAVLIMWWPWSTISPNRKKPKTSSGAPKRRRA